MSFIIENGILMKYEKDNNESDVIIPDVVKEIGSNAFSYCQNLKSVIIPDTVIHIRSGAFSYCRNLVSINIPSGVTRISTYTFSGCESLASINIPDNVTSIGDYAFGFCKNLLSVNIPNSIVDIGNKVFTQTPWFNSKKKENPFVIVNGIVLDCKTDSSDIIIPNNVRFVSELSFRDCINLKSISIHDGTRFPFKSTSFKNKRIYLNLRGVNHNYKFIIDFLKFGVDAQIVSDFICSNKNSRRDTVNKISNSFYRISLELFLAFEYDDEYSKDYLISNSKDVVKYCIDLDNAEILCSVLKLITIKKEDIDSLIDYSIKSKCIDIQLMLTDYKNKFIGFGNKSSDLFTDFFLD